MFMKRKFIFGVLQLSAATALGQTQALGIRDSLNYEADPALVVTACIDECPFDATGMTQGSLDAYDECGGNCSEWAD